MTLLEEGIGDVRLEPNANFSYKYLDESICSSVSVVPDLSMVHMSFSNGTRVDWHCSGTAWPTFKSCAHTGGLDGGATLNEETGRASSAPRFSYRARRRRLLRRAPTYVAGLLPGLRAFRGTNPCWGEVPVVGVGPPVLKISRNQLDRWAQGATASNSSQ